MDKNEKLRLQLAIDQADTWVKRYQKLNGERTAIRTAAAQALKVLRGGITPVSVDGHSYNVLPLGPQQMSALGNLARFIQLEPVAPLDAELLRQLDSEVPEALAEAGRALASKRPTEEDMEAAEFIAEYVPWGLHEGIPAALERTVPSAAAPQVDLSQALSPAYGLGNALKAYGTAQLLPASEVRSRLETFTEAEKYPELARAVTAAHDYVIVCSPAGASSQGFLASL